MSEWEPWEAPLHRITRPDPAVDRAFRLDLMGEPPKKPYLPVFAGESEDGPKIVLFKHYFKETELYITVDDGELWALSPGATVEMSFNIETSKFHLQVQSPEWSGSASGTRHDLLEAEAR